jgi:hypothetical protein
MIATETDSIIRLKEGKSYSFQITGVTNLPDESECFVLCDPNGIKHLLETKYYHYYQFEIGQSITCRIDKINCNGKIYIEPLHPYYRIGKAYDFPLVRIEDRAQAEKEKFAIFEDVFCNEIKLSLHYFTDLLQIGQRVKLKVVRIKKGQIILSEPIFNQEYTGMVKGKVYSFKLKDFIDLTGQQSFFIITSEDGLMYKLRFKYYEKYDLKVGQTVNCRLIKSGKETLLEPAHPFYQINSYYEFDIIGEETMPDYPEGLRKVYILKNDYGKNILIPAEKIKARQIRNGKLFCRVRDIRKGKLFLH